MSDSEEKAGIVVPFPARPAAALPGIDLVTVTETATHVVFALSVSRSLLAGGSTLLARLLNAALGS